MVLQGSLPERTIGLHRGLTRNNIALTSTDQLHMAGIDVAAFVDGDAVVLV
jgi:hypothetical protein